MTTTSGEPDSAEVREDKIMVALALADQVEDGVARRWACFWLGGLARSKDDPSLPLLDLILEGRLTFAEAMRADVAHATAGRRKA